MTSHKRARRLVAIAAASAIAPLLAGCTPIHILFPPPPNPKVLADAQQAQTDEKTLFAQLQQPAPACDATSVAPLFATVKADLEKVRADNVPQNPAVDQQAIQLEKQLADLQAGLPAPPACLPANIATTQQPLFELGLSQIVTKETPKG